VGVDSRKGLEREGRGRETRGRRRVHDGERGGRLGKGAVADRRGPQTSEDERAKGGQR
jgi:hypothetical protein